MRNRVLATVSLTFLVYGCGGTQKVPVIIIPPVKKIPETLAPEPIPVAENPNGAVQFDPMPFDLGVCYGQEGEEVPCPDHGILVSEEYALQSVLDKAAAKRLRVEAEANHSVALSAQKYAEELADWVQSDLPSQLETPEESWLEKHRGSVGLAVGLVLGAGLVISGSQLQ